MKKTVNGKSSIYAILGDPITHSMSPVLMNKNFELLDIDSVFLALKANLGDFEEIFTTLRKLEFSGYVFTMPVKEIALNFVDSLTKEAQIIGAINCAVNKEGQLIGSNTDSIGFWRAIEQYNQNKIEIQKIFVLGCGGFSKSAITQAAIQGVKHIVVSSKFEEKQFMASFEKFRERLFSEFPDVHIDLIDWAPGQWKSYLPDCDVIANGTPNGMGGKGDLHQIFPYDYVHHNSMFFDAIYFPRETRFLKEANKRGHICVEGLNLLVQQGAVSFNKYTGKEVDPSMMKEHILNFWKENN